LAEEGLLEWRKEKDEEVKEGIKSEWCSEHQSRDRDHEKLVLFLTFGRVRNTMLLSHQRCSEARWKEPLPSPGNEFE